MNRLLAAPMASKFVMAGGCSFSALVKSAGFIKASTSSIKFQRPLSILSFTEAKPACATLPSSYNRVNLSLYVFVQCFTFRSDISCIVLSSSSFRLMTSIQPKKRSSSNTSCTETYFSATSFLYVTNQMLSGWYDVFLTTPSIV